MIKSIREYRKKQKSICLHVEFQDFIYFYFVIFHYYMIFNSIDYDFIHIKLSSSKDK